MATLKHSKHQKSRKPTSWSGKLAGAISIVLAYNLLKMTSSNLDLNVSYRYFLFFNIEDGRSNSIVHFSPPRVHVNTRTFLCKTMQRNCSASRAPSVTSASRHVMSIQGSALGVDYGDVGRGIGHIDEILSREVVHRHDYDYVINPKHFCKGRSLLFLVYVHSAPDYFHRRQFIRQTWGNPVHHKTKFRVIFVLGIPSDKKAQNDLYAESVRYGDLVQENFQDSYRNLTLKAVASLRWIDRYCNQTKFVLKADDDTFVNMFNYIRYFTQIAAHQADYATNTVFCAVWYKMTVLRKGKWRVTYGEYYQNHYPDYCSGCAFTMTTDVARALHRVSYHVPAFWVDDVYVTGFLPRRIGNVTYKSFGYTYEMNARRLGDRVAGSQWWRYIFVSDNRDIKLMTQTWDKILQQNNITLS